MSWANYKLIYIAILLVGSDEEPLPADNLMAALKHLDEKEVVQQQQQVKKPTPQMSKSCQISLFVMV